MDNIQIIEKPGWISWDDIHMLLLEAHQNNRQNGIVQKYTLMPGEIIKKKLGKEGRCWVAMDGDKLVGTTSVTFFIGKKWWNRNKKTAHGCFTAILKKYQGIGIREKLDAKTLEFVKESGAEMIEGDTAENNKIMRRVWEIQGCKTVEFFASSSMHYSVRSIYWIGKCPFSDKYINRRFKISEKLTKWQFKPGRIERSFIISIFCKVINKTVNLLF